MMRVEHFVNKIKEYGFTPFTGIPCSVFKHLINYLDDNQEIQSYICSSEGEAMGLAGGFALSGKTPVVYMQNDGLGNAINPLSSLQLLYKLPALLLISWRAKPGTKDAPQHFLMGKTILELLDIFNIPCEILKDGIESLINALKKSEKHFKTKSTPFAFVMEKGYFEKYEKTITIVNNKLEKRIEYIKILSKHVGSNDVLLGATGFSGRELYQSTDFKGKFYMMGSMGCLASIGLAIAKENPTRNIYVLDGDGALLMKMGTLSTIGFHKPDNFIHICFNNNKYESTGGQKTSSSEVNFAEVARSCGYKSVEKLDTLIGFEEIISDIKKYPKPQFLHVKIKPGTIDVLKRPSESPEEMRDNLMEFLKR